MTWTSVGSISVGPDWQYTDPIEGSYFRLLHSSFPINSSYEVAQAQLMADGLLEITTIPTLLNPRPEAELIHLVAPPVFTSRRLAIRRVPKTPNLETQIRRVFREAVLSDPEINPFPPRRMNWQVSIEVSDYASSTPIVTGSTIPSDEQYWQAILADNPFAYWDLSRTSLNYSIVNQTLVSNPLVFTLEARFKTGATVAQSLVTFANTKGVASTSIDRSLYLNAAGRLEFMIYDGALRIITSPNTYNDGNWHSAVATLSPSGQELYVDGILVVSSANSTPENYNGYWHVGTENGAKVFQGSLAAVALFDTKLSSNRITAHHQAI